MSLSLKYSRQTHKGKIYYKSWWIILRRDFHGLSAWKNSQRNPLAVLRLPLVFPPVFWRENPSSKRESPRQESIQRKDRQQMETETLWGVQMRNSLLMMIGLSE